MSDNQKAWDVAIAEKFKERDNPKPIGAVLGKILRPLPDISIELLGGYGILDADKIYLSNAITNRLAIECTIKDFESMGNSTEGMESSFMETGTWTPFKPITLPLPSNDKTESVDIKIPKQTNEKENKTKGKFILQTVFNLIPGMYVLVIPNYEEDKFFVVDVFNYALEVSLEWEYYQK